MLFTTAGIKMTCKERKIILIYFLGAPVICKGFLWLNTLQRVFLEKSCVFSPLFQLAGFFSLLCRSLEDVVFGRTHLLTGSETPNTALRSLLSMLLCYIFIYILHNIYWAVFTGGASPKGRTGPFLQCGEEGVQQHHPPPVWK